MAWWRAKQAGKSQLACRHTRQLAPDPVARRRTPDGVPDGLPTTPPGRRPGGAGRRAGRPDANPTPPDAGPRAEPDGGERSAVHLTIRDRKGLSRI